MAQKIVRSKTPGAERMDAVMYLIGATEKFSRMSRQEVQKIGIEIATLGLTEFRAATDPGAPGLAIEDPGAPGLTTACRRRDEWGESKKETTTSRPGGAGTPCTTHHSPVPVGSLPGRFSGLHMVCLIYAAFKIFDPSADMG